MNTLFPEKYCVVGLSPMDDVTDYPFLAILKKNGTAVCSTLYISRISECEKTAYTTRYIDYIYAGGIPVAIHVKNNFLQTDSIYYVQTDLLGSWERIVNADKQVVQASHFDPWGNRMKPTLWHVPDTTKSFLFRRGFTGHEHYDRFCIINTGARLYDPVTARFFSPDPYVQDPFSTQAYNRYSYCWNNPIMYTDPTGEFIIIDAFIFGFVSGLWNGGWMEARKASIRSAKNDAKILGGLFQTDNNKTAFRQLWEVISRFTWQAPQIALGHTYSLGINLLGSLGVHNAVITNVDYAYGATVVTYNMNGSTAITLGNYINGRNKLSANRYNDLFLHEYGHYLQSQEMGPEYLKRVGLPSLLSKKPHKYHPIEIDANQRSYMYFKENVFTNGTADFWDAANNPLDSQYNNKETNHTQQSSYNDFIQATWYDYLFSAICGSSLDAVLGGLILTLYYNNQY